MEPDRKIIKQYFLSNDILLVKLYNNDNYLMILHKKSSPKYKNSPEHKDESELTTAEKHIKSYIKKENKDALLRTEVDGWTDIEIPVKSPSSNPTNWPLIIGLVIIVGTILLSGLIIFLKKRKRN